MSTPSKQIRFFSIAEVADFLSVSTRTIRRWIKDKKLVAHRFGGVVRIDEPNLQAFIAGHRSTIFYSRTPECQPLSPAVLPSRLVANP